MSSRKVHECTKHTHIKYLDRNEQNLASRRNETLVFEVWYAIRHIQVGNG